MRRRAHRNNLRENPRKGVTRWGRCGGGLHDPRHVEVSKKSFKMRRTSLQTPFLLMHLAFLVLVAASVNESAVGEGAEELADAVDSQGERCPEEPHTKCSLSFAILPHPNFAPQLPARNDFLMSLLAIIS